MRRIDLLVSQSRRITGNNEFTDETGIQDEEFFTWASAAQERLQGRILQAHSEAFLKEKEIQAVAGQEAYAIPEDAYLGTRIEKVEYSITGQEKDYYPLGQARLVNRDSLQSGNPDSYIRRDKTILLQAKPQQAGKIRVTYQYCLPRLDKKRATVLAVTLDTSAKTITALQFDSTLDMDSVRIADEGYITLVDRDGVVQMRKVPVDAVSSTGVVTVTPGFVYQDGETIAVGNRATLGAHSSTHSQLPETAERYLLEYMNWKAYKSDSNSDSVEESQELLAIEEEIVDSFKEPDMDTDSIPVISGEFLTSDDG